MRVIAQRRPQHRMRGISLVELMIGIAVGLFIVAAATLLTTSHLDDNRRLMLETQVQQDMRAAMDMITRDLRRAGFSQAAMSGVWSKTNVNAAANANAYTSLGTGSPTEPLEDDFPVSNIRFDYSLGGADNVVDSADEAGFKLDGGVVSMKLGAGGYQQLTDPTTLTVTQLTFRLKTQPINLSDNCVVFCDPAVTATCPKQLVRDIEVKIVGQAANDARVQRSLVSNVRLPNDVVTGQCPAP